MLGITYKSSWFMAHRIREAMTPKARGPLGGKVIERPRIVTHAKSPRLFHPELRDSVHDWRVALCLFLGFDPPDSRVRFHVAVGAAITANELPYASVKATEATAPEAAEASTAAPSRRIGGTRFSVKLMSG
jgi:hypothetical protein